MWCLVPTALNDLRRGSIIDLYSMSMQPQLSLWQTQIGKLFGGPFPLITYVFISAASLFMLSAPVRGCALVCINNRNISDWMLIAIQQPEWETGRKEPGMQEETEKQTQTPADGRESNNDDRIYRWRIKFKPFWMLGPGWVANIPNILHAALPSLHSFPASLSNTHLSCMRGHHQCLPMFLNGLACL